MPSGPNNLGDYLQRKAAKLDLGRGDDLALIQDYLESLYPGKTRATGLQKGVLTIRCSSSAVMSELRLRQVEIVKNLEPNQVTKLTIYGA